MRGEVFVDAGAWIALASVDDQHHASARQQYRRLLTDARPLVTTNLVVSEAFTAIRRTGGHVLAMRYLQSMGTSARLRRIYSDAAIEELAERILNRYADQDFSFVDAVSFVAMQERGITEAFAFDHHFLIAGFTLLHFDR